MNIAQLEKMKNDKGFIAALDQSGGSTPKALKLYGIDETNYSNEDEMFDLVHKMRTRIIKSKSFTKDKILGAILFKVTMNSKIDDKLTADYLWEEKGIIPFLKIDEGLAELKDGVQLMKEMKELDSLLETAKERHIFGTKMRSVIKEYNEEGIKKAIAQQFEYAKKISKAGFVPIIEPEVDINSKDKDKIEKFMKDEIIKELNKLDKNTLVMFKFTIPTTPNLYDEISNMENVVRVVALSGGYSREESNKLLLQNKNLIASFSRALTEGLTAQMSDDEFDNNLYNSIDEIYKASSEK